MPAQAAFYFSGVTYTTLGYSDLVLAKPWRLLGPNRVSRREARYETRDALVDGKMD